MMRSLCRIKFAPGSRKSAYRLTGELVPAYFESGRTFLTLSAMQLVESYEIHSDMYAAHRHHIRCTMLLS